MKLEEFKKALESEATVKNKTLEEENENLKKQIKTKNDHLRVLYNRCLDQQMSLGSALFGFLCMHCELAKECKKMSTAVRK